MVLEDDMIISKELYADWLAEQYVLVGVRQESCSVVTAEDLDLAAVATAAQQETPVGRDIEVARMDSRGLVADSGEHSGLLVDSKDGDTVIFQPIARI